MRLTAEHAKALYTSNNQVFIFVNGEGYKPMTVSSRTFEQAIALYKILYPQALDYDFVDVDGYWEYKAISHAERIGIYEFDVNPKARTMKYISYFGSEGFIKVTYHLDTEAEERVCIKTTKKAYNYFCG